MESSVNDDSPYGKLVIGKGQGIPIDVSPLDLSNFKAMGWSWEGHLHWYDEFKPEGYVCPGCQEKGVVAVTDLSPDKETDEEV